MVMPVMHGGGAERVAALLLNEFHKCGYHCEFMLTHDMPETVVRNDLASDIPLTFLQDFFSTQNSLGRIWTAILKMIGSLFCKFIEFFHLPVPACFAYISFIGQYHREIHALHEVLKRRPDTTVITFLQPSIPIVMLAAHGLPNRVVFSERGDARRLMAHRYGRSFIRKYYQRADAAVFQTEEARNTYPSNIAAKGSIIINPLKANLPDPFVGERRKVINTFCRISKQKNLMVLLKAYHLLNKKYPQYRLHIIGDALNDEGKTVLEELKQFVRANQLDETVSFLPFTSSVHQEIIADAMYVNSSDYEGISNAMLEAMAIGLPVICTNCPVGGARAVIHDHENGLLVPVRDVKALAQAMNEVIENPDLVLWLTKKGTRIRTELNVQNITRFWIKVI